MYSKTKRLKEGAEYMRKMQVEDGLTPAPETYGEMVGSMETCKIDHWIGACG